MKDSIITKISTTFINNSRLTILLSLVILIGGYFSYTTYLKREGFPAINVPIVIVNTPYFTNDPVKTDKDVTSKIYKVVKDIEGVDSIQSTSTDKISSLVISLDSEITDAQDIKEEISTKISELRLPSESIVTVPNAGLIDGQNDILLSIHSDELNIKELQEEAVEIKTELLKISEIKEVNIKEQYVEQFDFKKQKDVTTRNSFSRITVLQEGGLKTYDSLNIGVVKADEELGALEFSELLQNSLNTILLKEEFKSIEVEYTGDPAISLNQQISSLENNALAAIITIFLILLLFINFRSAIILALFIPLTLAATFITFAILGYTLNTISLFALVLVLGLFVDDGTIVVEAIDYYKRQGFKGIEAVKRAINDIGIADISGTLTTVLVFVPLTFVTGVLGDFIKILPLTVIISLLVSLVIALTVLPFISTYIIKNRSEKTSIFEKIFNFFPSIILKIGELGGLIVSKSLSSIPLQILSVIIAVGLISVGGYYATKLSFSFFAPAKDSDLISINISFDQDLDINDAIRRSKQLENLIIKEYSNEIVSIAYFNATSRDALIRVQLTPLNERDIKANEIAIWINENSKDIKDSNINAGIISAGPPANQYPFAMQVFNQDKKELSRLTNNISKYIEDQDLGNGVEIEDVKIEYISDIRKEDNNRYAQIRVKFNEKYDSATLIDLQERIESTYTTEKLLSITKDDDIETKLGFDFGQESDNADSFSSVAIAGVIALVAMYIVLVIQFNSFVQPILVLLAIPFSFPGLFSGLYYTNNPMSFFVVIGLTGLIGIVVNNTIILIEYANSQRLQGKSIKDAISEAVKLRTRAIITTSVTTVAGLLPLAITEPFWEPLAFTIIFGLLSSLVMIIISFPVFYYLIENLRAKVKGLIFGNR